MKVLLIEEVAAILRCSVENVLAEIATGNLAAFSVGGQLRVIESELHRFASGISQVQAQGPSSQQKGMSTSPTVATDTAPDLQLAMQTASIPAFTYVWPDGEPNEYRDPVSVTVEYDGKRAYFVIGKAKSAKKQLGQIRWRYNVFLSSTPRSSQGLISVLDFVAGNEFDHDHLMVSLIRHPDGRLVKESDAIPHDYRDFRLDHFNTIVRGPYARSGLAVVVDKDDLRTMIRHAVIRAIQKGWLGWYISAPVTIPTGAASTTPRSFPVFFPEREAPMPQHRHDLLNRFSAAVAALDEHFSADPSRLEDQNVDAQLRGWLDGRDNPLPWAGPQVTPDEWFFVTTLYGQETLDQQRRHIRHYFPMFAELAQRDIRNLKPDLVGDWTLRSDWMKARLCHMGEILRNRDMTMAAYVEHLRRVEQMATPRDPMPALDAIIKDHRATGWKTLSVFVRDCVGGNCFPIDSRVENELRRHGLPVNERLLVGLSLSLDRNPRQIARMFFEAGGEGGNFSSKFAEQDPMPGETTRRASLATDTLDRGTGFANLSTRTTNGRTTMTRELDSLDRLDSGYVLNLFGGPTGRIGNVVHPHDCHHLKRMTIPPRKIWATTVAELEEWVKAQGGELDPKTPTCRNV